MQDAVQSADECGDEESTDGILFLDRNIFTCELRMLVIKYICLSSKIF